MEETSEELPNFSIGIDLLGPDPTSNKNKAEKNSQVARFANLLEDQLSDTWVHLALILILSFSLTIIGWLDEMYSLKQKYKMWRVFDQPIGTIVYFFTRCDNFALYHNKRLLRKWLLIINLASEMLLSGPIFRLKRHM